MTTNYKLSICLLVLVVGSAVATVFVKHSSRAMFVELQALQRQFDEMQIEWNKLQLEESTWATHDRVRSIAVKRLGLYMPPGDAVVLVGSP